MNIEELEILAADYHSVNVPSELLKSLLEALRLADSIRHEISALRFERAVAEVGQDTLPFNG